MTAKPSPVGTQVGIQRRAMKGFQPVGYPPPLCLPHKRGLYCLYSEAVAHEAAVLNRVREMLEAKAKEWRDEVLLDYPNAATGIPDGADWAQITWNDAAELLSLAATLGNQGK